MKHYDIIIIGSGIAGISLGSIISKERKVAIIEKEKQLSYHSTGRSFAFFIESYGNNAIIELTKISKKFFYDNFNLFLKKKGVMFIGNNKQKTIVEDFYNEHKHKVKLELFSKNETIKLANCLNEDYVNNSVIDINASEIDVNNLYEYYRKKYNKNDGLILTDFNINLVEYKNNKWILNNKISSDIIVNASGAWADEVAKLFKIKPVNVVPKIRTVFVFKPQNIKIDNNCPLVADIEEKFYFKDQNDQIYASPADETPSYPHDCHPDDLDIAIGIDRIQKATKFKFNHIDNKWSGLRTFVKDKSPVIGYENSNKNFFWLVAQGGYGIQTSPALAEISANIILNKKNDFLIDNSTLNNISIKRLRNEIL